MYDKPHGFTFHVLSVSIKQYLMFGMGHTKLINMLLFNVKVANCSHLIISNYTIVYPIMIA